MLKFIIENNFRTDIIFELLQAEKYMKWLGDPIKIYNDKNIISKEDIFEVCPVGSIEFVQDWYRDIWNIKYKPINIPTCKGLGLKRKIYKTIADVPEGHKVFVKSMEKLKHPGNGLYKYTNDIDLAFGWGEELQISDYIDDIISEWRIFVKTGEMIDIKNYLGDPWIIPDKKYIQSMILQPYLSSFTSIPYPPAFTIDVMISKSKGTDLIEIHDFFSCGLYGFSDIKKYPYMLYQWFKWFTKFLRLRNT